MNLNSVKEHHFKDDKKFIERDRFQENLNMNFDDLFMGLMDDSPLAQHNFTTLFNPYANDDKEQLLMGQGSSALSSNNLMQSEDVESVSPRYLSDAVVKQLMSNPAANNMSFSVEQGLDKLHVEAVIRSGCLHCDIKPSNDNLGRKLRRSKQEIEKNIGSRMRLQVEISIDSERV